MLVSANEVLIDQGSWILAEVHRHPQHQTQDVARLHRAACCRTPKKKLYKLAHVSYAYDALDFSTGVADAPGVMASEQRCVTA